ncbi:uncharacterized protein LOC110234342 isoform X2 [Exaiptasia diaphana]|uniref:Uncharacterized protein n=1 Tax=Exaiptasia diaphana TaxID=2652724 RepID=A0A913WWZ6_EXADI|nr:uncharacterized protein LOC110234342 isoform X2 [Exaiptasia diaphana]
MWFYFIAHCAYHFVRWFPKANRKAVERSKRYCDQPLLNISVSCIVFTFAMIAFSFLFAMMEPVPWQLKIAFHFFGFGSLLMGLVLFASSLDVIDCPKYVPELYYLCLSFGIFAILSAGFIIIMLPFWLVNYLWPDSVLNRRERRGVCYEPVKCCTCLWHI